VLLVASGWLATTFTASAATGVQPQDIWDYDAFTRTNNFTFESRNIPDWDKDMERKECIVIFRTSKAARTEELSSVTTRHTRGASTTLAVGIGLLTEEETIHKLGIEARTKLLVVAANVGSGDIWGDANSRTVRRENTHTEPATASDSFITLRGTATIREYYLYVYTVVRTVERDKNSNSIGYSNYRFVPNVNSSGGYDNFDLKSPVNTQVVRGAV
jgi:hypothetical protein